MASNGYVLIKVGKGHPLADVRGYAYEHRLVASQAIGRWVRADEQVHHRDENPLNNAPENLEVLPPDWHRVRHRKGGKGLQLPGEPNPLVTCACGCTQAFSRFDESGRPRRYVSGHNPPEREAQRAILAVLQSGPAGRAELARLAGREIRVVAVTLSRLKKLGEVRQVARGVWALSEGS